MWIVIPLSVYIKKLWIYFEIGIQCSHLWNGKSPWEWILYIMLSNISSVSVTIYNWKIGKKITTIFLISFESATRSWEQRKCVEIHVDNFTQKWTTLMNSDISITLRIFSRNVWNFKVKSMSERWKSLEK